MESVVDAEEEDVGLEEGEGRSRVESEESEEERIEKWEGREELSLGKEGKEVGYGGGGGKRGRVIDMKWMDGEFWILSEFVRSKATDRK